MDLQYLALKYAFGSFGNYGSLGYSWWIFCMDWLDLIYNPWDKGKPVEKYAQN